MTFMFFGTFQDASTVYRREARVLNVSEWACAAHVFCKVGVARLCTTVMLGR